MLYDVVFPLRSKGVAGMAASAQHSSDAMTNIQSSQGDARTKYGEGRGPASACTVL